MNKYEVIFTGGSDSISVDAENFEFGGGGGFLLFYTGTVRVAAVNTAKVLLVRLVEYGQRGNTFVSVYANNNAA